MYCGVFNIGNIVIHDYINYNWIELGFAKDAKYNRESIKNDLQDHLKKCPTWQLAIPAKHILDSLASKDRLILDSLILRFPNNFPRFIKELYSTSNTNIYKISNSNCQDRISLLRANTFIKSNLYDNFEELLVKNKTKNKAVFIANRRLKANYSLNSCHIDGFGLNPNVLLFNDNSSIVANNNLSITIEGEYPLMEVYDKYYIMKIPPQKFSFTYDLTGSDFGVLNIIVKVDKLDKVKVVNQDIRQPQQFERNTVVGSVTINFEKYYLGQIIDTKKENFLIQN
ncbi:MAG: hypothetical protein IPG12_13490 [Saprospiraceae bacterium]|nr:hypothetical protein [Saprospiraceae bacterium]